MKIVDLFDCIVHRINLLHYNTYTDTSCPKHPPPPITASSADTQTEPCNDHLAHAMVSTLGRHSLYFIFFIFDIKPWLSQENGTKKGFVEDSKTESYV